MNTKLTKKQVANIESMLPGVKIIKYQEAIKEELKDKIDNFLKQNKEFFNLSKKNSKNDFIYQLSLFGTRIKRLELKSTSFYQNWILNLLNWVNNVDFKLIVLEAISDIENRLLNEE